MTKETYTFKEVREMLGIGEKAFKGMRERSEIITMGKLDLVARAELERVLGHPIEQPATTPKSSMPEMIDLSTLDGKVAYCSHTKDGMEKFSNNVVAMIEGNEEAKSDCEEIIKYAKENNGRAYVYLLQIWYGQIAAALAKAYSKTLQMEFATDDPLYQTYLQMDILACGVCEGEYFDKESIEQYLEKHPEEIVEDSPFGREYFKKHPKTTAE